MLPFLASVWGRVTEWATRIIGATGRKARDQANDNQGRFAISAGSTCGGLFLLPALPNPILWPRLAVVRLWGNNGVVDGRIGGLGPGLHSMKTLRPNRTAQCASQAPGGLSDHVSRADPWLASHRRWVLTTLVLLAAGIRVCYFVQLNAGPLVETHRWDGKDMNYFDFWARRVCAGDWLSAEVPLPFHTWHSKLRASTWNYIPM